MGLVGGDFCSTICVWVFAGPLALPACVVGCGAEALSVTSLDPRKLQKHTCEAGQSYFFSKPSLELTGKVGSLWAM